MSCEANGTLFSSGARGGGTYANFGWPNYTFPQTYKIDVIANDLNPTTCVSLIVRKHYGLGACAHGDIYITRYDQTSVILAARAFKNPSKYLQVSVRVNGSTLALTAFSSSNPETIDLTATDVAYTSSSTVSLGVYTVDTTPASAILSAFRYESQS